MSELDRLLSSLPPGDLVSNPLILVPSFNNGAYLLNFLQQLEERNLNRYLVFDGGSSEPATRKVLKKLEGENRVLVLPSNPGPRYFFESKEILECLPPIFCVSDPDLSFNDQLPEDFLLHLYDLSVEFSIGKVGMALDIDGDLVDSEFFFYGEWHTIRDWEAQFWQHPTPNALNLEVYRAEIDTTFALYNKTYLRSKDFFSAIRVAGTFTATHLPWLRSNPLDEGPNSRTTTVSNNWTTWSQGNSLAALRAAHEQNELRIRQIENSFSWAITAPLRAIGRVLQRVISFYSRLPTDE